MTVRFKPQTRKELDRVAGLGGVTPSDVVRLCVQLAMPAVEHGFNEMAAMVKKKDSATKAQK